MKIMISMMLLSASIISCTKEIPKVKHVRMPTLALDLKNIKVENPEDLICNMETSKFLKDTAEYKEKVYGFCSASCKKQFKKNPEKYVQNEK